MLLLLQARLDTFLSEYSFSCRSKINITEVASAASEEVARQEKYLESLFIIIFNLFLW